MAGRYQRQTENRNSGKRRLAYQSHVSATDLSKGKRARPAIGECVSIMPDGTRSTFVPKVVEKPKVRKRTVIVVKDVPMGKRERRMRGVIYGESWNSKG